MILPFLLLLLITCGGTLLTYLYEKEDSLLARLAAGNVIGASVFGTVAFLLACAFGLSAAVVVVSLVVALSPLALLAKTNVHARFKADFDCARGSLNGADFARILRFVYYVAAFLVLWFFFERAMIETKDGIFTGGSQNLGDLPFHLGAIFSFTEGAGFPPDNPSFAGAKFTYPFLVDFITACLMKLGAGVREAMQAQNVLLGLSLVVMVEKFTVKLTNNKLAGKIAPVLLLLSGGLGFVWFFKDYADQTQSLTEFLWKLPQDYTIGEKFRWGNSLVALFLTQRGLLFGMPLALIALTKIWEIFSSDGGAAEDREEETAEDRDETPAKESDGANDPAKSRSREVAPSLLVGLLAGTLVLIHVHSLAALFVVCAMLFFFRLDRWREWIAFAAGVAIVAVPELVWFLTGSASNLSKFIEPHFGWDAGKQNFLVFWAKNIGLFAPVLVAGLILVMMRNRAESQPAEQLQNPSELQITKDKLQTKTQNPKPKTQNPNSKSEDLLIFYLPFAFIFLISNTMKLAPWEWDNIKVLIYWFVGSLPFAALFLAWAWRQNALLKTVAATCLIILTLSGALDVWRTISRQINYQVFSSDAVKIAEEIKRKTPAGAMFLNAPTYNSAVVLTGRRSLMRYSGHLSSYGIDYAPREAEVKRIYEGGALADRLLEKNGIEYVIISPEESGNVDVREEFFYKYPIVAETGAYKVFKVK